MADSSTRMRVTLGEDEDYVFDRDALTLADLYQIKSASGLDFNPFLQGVGDASPESLQTLIWFLRHKAGIQGDRLQVEFKIGDLDIQPIDESDPTLASSGTSDAAISEDSPTTAT